LLTTADEEIRRAGDIAPGFDSLKADALYVTGDPLFNANRRRCCCRTGIGVDLGKNSFHVVGQDKRGAIVLRQKWSRGQVEARLANMQPCLVGVESYVDAHHLGRKLQALWSRCSADAGETCARFEVLCFLF
jgi:hypothetical protein